MNEMGTVIQVNADGSCDVQLEDATILRGVAFDGDGAPALGNKVIVQRDADAPGGSPGAGSARRVRASSGGDSV